MSSSDSDANNEISNELFVGKNNRRSKREADFSNVDPTGDIQNIWQGVLNTMVDGAKQIVQKVAEGLGQDPDTYMN